MVRLTLAGQALLDRTRPVLLEVDAAVTAAQSVGGELAARMCEIWQALVRAVALDEDIEAVRSAWESVHAHSASPPETGVRAVTAGGAPALVVGDTNAGPRPFSTCTAGDTCSAPRSAAVPRPPPCHRC